MSFEHRLFDDAGFVSAGATDVIPVVSLLLEHLQLEHADHATQVAGIRRWLRDNTPTPSLLRSIERKGYAEAFSSADELVESHLALVAHAVKGMATRLPPHVDAEELVSAGYVALVVAARSFDVEAKVPFERYATARIRAALVAELRALDRVAPSRRGGDAAGFGPSGYH